MADNYTWEKQDVKEEECEWWWPNNWTVEGVKAVILLAGYTYVTYKFLERNNRMSV